MDARTRRLAGLAIIAAGIVLAIVGGLADQVGIGANDESEIGGKQIAVLVVGLLLIAGGAVLSTVLANDTGEAGEAAATAAPGDAANATPTPAAGTPVTDVAEPADTDDTADDDTADDDTAEVTDEPSDTAEPPAEAEPVEVTDSSSD